MSYRKEMKDIQVWNYETYSEVMAGNQNVNI